jgi:CRP-like cAMP-binding protein
MGTPQPNIESELRGLAFAAAWPDGMIVEIAKLAEKVVYPCGSVIFREGDRNDKIYLILSGRVALEMSVPARGRVRLLTLSDGELLGDHAADRTPHGMPIELKPEDFAG